MANFVCFQLHSSSSSLTNKKRQWLGKRSQAKERKEVDGGGGGGERKRERDWTAEGKQERERESNIGALSPTKRR